MPPGPSWAPTGLQELPREAPKTLPEHPGGEKNDCYLPGGSGEISQRDFTLPGGPGERFGLHFRSSRGSFWPSVWRSVLKMRRSQFSQTVHAKTLISRVPGASRGSILEPKNRYRNDLEALSAQKPAPGVQESLPERSWRASGPPPKNGNFQKRPRGVLERFFIDGCL